MGRDIGVLSAAFIQPHALLDAFGRQQADELTVFNHRENPLGHQPGQDLCQGDIRMQTFRLDPNRCLCRCAIPQPVNGF